MRVFVVFAAAVLACIPVLSLDAGPAFEMYATTPRKDGSFAYDERNPLLSVDRVQSVTRDPQSGDYDLVLLPEDAKKLARVMLVAIVALWLIGPTASLLVDLTLHLAGSKSCICLFGNSDPYSDADPGLDAPSRE